MVCVAITTTSSSTTSSWMRCYLCPSIPQSWCCCSETVLHLQQCIIDKWREVLSREVCKATFWGMGTPWRDDSSPLEAIRATNDQKKGLLARLLLQLSFKTMLFSRPAGPTATRVMRRGAASRRRRCVRFLLRSDGTLQCSVCFCVLFCVYLQEQQHLFLRWECSELSLTNSLPSPSTVLLFSSTWVDQGGWRGGYVCIPEYCVRS